MILKENEICPYSDKCPYNNLNNICQGTVKRNNVFSCSYVNEEDGSFNGSIRNENDKTGKMKVLMENQNGRY